MREFTEQEKVRREKVNQLKEKGVKPFGGRFDVTSNSKIIKKEHENQSKEELEQLKDHVIIAGRIMTKRRKGRRKEGRKEGNGWKEMDGRQEERRKESN